MNIKYILSVFLILLVFKSNGQERRKTSTNYKTINDYKDFAKAIGYDFETSEKNKSKKNEQESLIQTCPRTALLSPKNKDSYLMDSDIKPEFSWANRSKDVKGYQFRLYEGEELIYTKNTKSTSINLDRILQSYYDDQSKEQNYQWQIKTKYQDCPDQYTAKQTFTIRTLSSIAMNITNIECLSPAFNSSTGMVRYKAKVEFASVNNSNPWIISSISLLEAGITIPISALNNCTTPVSIAPYAPLIPNNFSVGCFEFSVPIGSTTQTFQTNGTWSNASGIVSVIKSLPSCACNICDINNPDGWQIIPVKKIINKQNNSNYNMKITTDFKIVNANPIQKVKAEIVSVQRNTADEICFTCTKQDNSMGMFWRGSGSGKGISSFYWQNNGYATLQDVNNDNYGNEFTWKANNSLGVDFSTSKRFFLKLNLPEIPSLECCDTKYEICVRYTFEDINCQTCDYLTCYEYEYQSGNNVLTPIGGFLTPNRIIR